ncbi:hypothetical protein SS1G_09259 [Sclerotinia sclerotiorum 1980 UF-70]|uniref:Uncharacterized protein n=1 Tax=Sclerotinia sclerotiorum (strain ATCC 18683 / 1980 / Ss-1) TaxID=665079 RepID=A7EVA1_SCLS1|nr:hypothetical protein SS1G_09259 [Sclerotinia sclerotiorum 1980 UF-70]EDN93393.1 hypothetical protein SS1G_09259 [Sclerotinia sclerotiorum 1980 UF-70]
MTAGIPAINGMKQVSNFAFTGSLNLCQRKCIEDEDDQEREPYPNSTTGIIVALQVESKVVIDGSLDIE